MTMEQLYYEIDDALIDCEDRWNYNEADQKEYCEKCGSSVVWDRVGNLYHCLDPDCRFVGVEPIVECV